MCSNTFKKTHTKQIRLKTQGNGSGCQGSIDEDGSMLVWRPQASEKIQVKDAFYSLYPFSAFLKS